MKHDLTRSYTSGVEANATWQEKGDETQFNMQLYIWCWSECDVVVERDETRFNMQLYIWYWSECDVAGKGG